MKSEDDTRGEWQTIKSRSIYILLKNGDVARGESQIIKSRGKSRGEEEERRRRRRGGQTRINHNTTHKGSGIKPYLISILVFNYIPLHWPQQQ